MFSCYNNYENTWTLMSVFKVLTNALLVSALGANNQPPFNGHLADLRLWHC